MAGAAGAVVRRAAAPGDRLAGDRADPAGRGRPRCSASCPSASTGFGYHYYEWLLPPGAVPLARSAACLQAFRLDERPVWGMQFHPEVRLADLGSWLDAWDDEPEALATGLDPEAIRAESAEQIGAWNEVGRAISGRFLAAAAGVSPAVSGRRRSARRRP